MIITYQDMETLTALVLSSKPDSSYIAVKNNSIKKNKTMSFYQFSKESAVEEFFSIASPLQVRKSLLDVFMYYIIHLDRSNIPKDITLIAEDIFLLMQFLEKMEDERLAKIKAQKV